jgi:hypothetical protein
MKKTRKSPTTPPNDTHAYPHEEKEGGKGGRVRGKEAVAAFYITDIYQYFFIYIYLGCKIDVAARSNQQRRHALMPVSRRSVQSRFSILFFYFFYIFFYLIIHVYAAISSSAAAA